MRVMLDAAHTKKRCRVASPHCSSHRAVYGFNVLLLCLHINVQVRSFCVAYVRHPIVDVMSFQKSNVVPIRKLVAVSAVVSEQSWNFPRFRHSSHAQRDGHPISRRARLTAVERTSFSRRDADGSHGRK